MVSHISASFPVVEVTWSGIDTDPCAGAVSGPKGCVVMIQDALKKPWPNVPPPPKPAEVNQEKREAVGAKTENSS